MTAAQAFQSMTRDTPHLGVSVGHTSSSPCSESKARTPAWAMGLVPGEGKRYPHRHHAYKSLGAAAPVCRRRGESHPTFRGEWRRAGEEDPHLSPNSFLKRLLRQSRLRKDAEKGPGEQDKHTCFTPHRLLLATVVLLALITVVLLLLWNYTCIMVWHITSFRAGGRGEQLSPALSALELWSSVCSGALELFLLWSSGAVSVLDI
ncbi:hypothetical protein JZ751_025529 [Albula glossodonta]|uniref:Uncharacterized protein n=1 Tax=Albula glossodonta TaxID=121402 RepID=A0A8T2MXK4_9TELE|nr:hypothetical protein JZ751_025529 [Albula glossodonta]